MLTLLSLPRFGSSGRDSLYLDSLWAVCDPLLLQRYPGVHPVARTAPMHCCIVLMVVEHPGIRMVSDACLRFDH